MTSEIVAVDDEVDPRHPVSFHPENAGCEVRTYQDVTFESEIEDSVHVWANELLGEELGTSSPTPWNTTTPTDW